MPAALRPSAPMSKRKRLQGDAAGDDALQIFRRSVQELKTKSTKKISNLVELAEQQKESAAQVTMILAEEIQGAPVSRLQPLFSVVDSILKKTVQCRPHMAIQMPGLIQSAVSKSDVEARQWLHRIVTESWRRHDLLPVDVLGSVDAIFAAAASGGAAPGSAAATAAAGAAASKGVKEEAAAPAAQSASSARETQQSANKAPRVKEPPPQRPATKVEAKVEPIVIDGDPADTPMAVAAAISEADVLQRRLAILEKIVDRQKPSAQELEEISKVPEIRKVMVNTQKGNKAEAMAQFQKFKQELAKKVDLAAAASAASDVHARPVDPRQPEARAADPRQADARKPADPRTGARPSAVVDPRLPPGSVADPRQSSAPKPVDPRQAAVDPRQQDPRQKARQPEPGQEAEGEKAAKETSLETARQIVQGLPSIGFSEAWLQQFLEQLPTRPPQTADAPRKTQAAPLVGRKVLSAEGEQMVYVAELSPSEVLLLLQFVFLLEENLRRSGRGVDLTQRIPHSFSYLQVEPCIDVMLRRFYDELPYQCPTTGLRFASRESLRYSAVRPPKPSARGWMESIPDWVGNRDLVVGPALFNMGTDDAPRAQRAQRLALEAAQSDDEDEEGERGRWVVPFDERRGLCPISGEPFERTWSDGLNDWAFEGVVAVELGTTDKVLRYPPRGGDDPERLSEAAVLFKKSCFTNTTAAKRSEAVEECSMTHAYRSLLGDAPAGAGAAVAAASPKAADLELASLFQAKKAPAKFF